MPFSRRAEAEADLIGLKLMALAGYNAEKAPETFRRLGADGGRRQDGEHGWLQHRAHGPPGAR